jgi:hypothetical protein
MMLEQLRSDESPSQQAKAAKDLARLTRTIAPDSSA